jgi:hypothetical protein
MPADHPLIPHRVHPGEKHTGCGGQIRAAHGRHGPYLGCSDYWDDNGCRTTWDRNGWPQTTAQRLHDTPTGLPLGHDLRGLHHGHWEHHHFLMPAQRRGDWTPEGMPDYAEHRISVLDQLLGRAHDADIQRVGQVTAQWQAQVEP